MHKGFAPIFIIFIAAVIFGVGVLYYAKVLKKPAQVACTQEAKQCPDGSYVGRTGPNCEFAACPASSAAQSAATSSVDVSTAHSTDSTGSPQASSGQVSVETETWKIYKNAKYGFRFSYPADHAPFSIDPASGKIVPVATSSDSVSIGGRGAVLKVEAVLLDEPIDIWLNDNLAKYVPDPKTVSRKDTTVAGKRAVEIVDQQSPGSTGFYEGTARIYKLYVVQPGNYLLIITETAQSSVLDAVFSTLSFTP